MVIAKGCTLFYLGPDKNIPPLSLVELEISSQIRQVFWLTAFYSPCLPILKRTVANMVFATGYSDGTALDSHEFPF